MKREIIIAKVVSKLSQNIQKETDNLIKNLERFAINEPKNIIKFLQTFYNKYRLSQQECLKLIGKIQQKGIIDKSLKSHKDAEKAWRLILKEWKIPNFRLERGAY